jgi:hypothetical protein
MITLHNLLETNDGFPSHTRSYTDGWKRKLTVPTARTITTWYNRVHWPRAVFDYVALLFTYITRPFRHRNEIGRAVPTAVLTNAPTPRESPGHPGSSQYHYRGCVISVLFWVTGGVATDVPEPHACRSSFFVRPRARDERNRAITIIITQVRATGAGEHERKKTNEKTIILRNGEVSSDASCPRSRFLRHAKNPGRVRGDSDSALHARRVKHFRPYDWYIPVWFDISHAKKSKPLKCGCIGVC